MSIDQSAFASVMPTERLMAAVAVSDEAIAAEALAAGADASFNRSGNPLLLQAASNNSPGMANLLMDAGADPNLGNRRGWLPIHEAAQKGYAGIIKAIAARPMVILSIAIDGLGPIHLAAKGGFEDCVDALLSARVSVDSASSQGKLTPLMLAVEGRYEGLTRYLINKGASPDKADDTGRTARDRAADWPEGQALLGAIPAGVSVSAAAPSHPSASSAQVTVEETPKSEEAAPSHEHLGIGAIRKRGGPR